MPDLRSDPFDNGDDGEDLGEDADRESGASDDGKTQKSSDKRVSDLQSKADKETARANKAEAQLKRLLEAAKDPDTEASKSPAVRGDNVMDNAILDMARMFAYQQNPKLAEYGVAASDLSGDSPGAIAGHATELIARFEKVETQVRNKMLAEQGHAPEIESATAGREPRDFSKMSTEDFNKLVDATLNKRR